MRLTAASAARLHADVSRPAYDRDSQARGIVHFGLGAFTRAHQAAYTDAAMGLGDSGWMITGVSLRSAGVAQQLNPQDGLYLIAERGGEGTRYRLGGAIRNVLTAPQDTQAVIAAIADPARGSRHLDEGDHGDLHAVAGIGQALFDPAAERLYRRAAYGIIAASGLAGLTIRG